MISTNIGFWGVGARQLSGIDDYHKACAAIHLAQGVIIVVQRGERAYYLSLKTG